MTWQDISSAPRDGTPVDLWIVGETDDVDLYAPNARKVEGKPLRHGRVTDFQWEKRGLNPPNWYSSGGRGYPLPLTVTAVAWMALPEPPKEPLP